jgi:hypothetical protein
VASARRQRGDPVSLLNATRFVLTLWTDSVELAAAADAAGIDRVGVDLEQLGKRERQRGLGTWISPHRRESLAELRAALEHAQLFARVDPLNPGSSEQVEDLLEHGVEVLMLPMFHTAEEVSSFLDIVAGRARTVLLVETRAACEQIEEILALVNDDELHLGINDLALSLGSRSRFDVLSSAEVERVASCARERCVRLGIGGVGRLDDAHQPIEPDLLYAEYVRLGASASLISRAFLPGPPVDPAALASDVADTRARLEYWRSASSEAQASAHGELRRVLRARDVW